jgi:hypothetical protein
LSSSSTVRASSPTGARSAGNRTHATPTRPNTNEESASLHVPATYSFITTDIRMRACIFGRAQLPSVRTLKYIKVIHEWVDQIFWRH